MDGKTARARCLEVQSLYDANRFIDAYDATRDDWENPQIAAELDADELILAGRLARRLGSSKFSRALFRLARDRFPENPMVFSFTRGVDRRRWSLLDELRTFEQVPDLRSGDAELDSDWHAKHAICLAYLRDFQRAHAMLERAHAIREDSPWVIACEAGVRFEEDDWDGALRCAERAWELRPGLPYAGHLLGRSLATARRTMEGARRLLEFSRRLPQSFEILVEGLQLALAAYERGHHEIVEAAGGSLLEAARRLAGLAPVADRQMKTMIARICADAAKLEGRREALLEHAREARSFFYDRVAANLQEKLDGRRVLLRHLKFRQQHNTCLPASMVACASVFEHELDHDELVRKMTYDGTATWRVLDWAEERGWTARPFIADRASCEALLGEGIPFLFTMRSLSFSHAVAAVGIDLGMGTLLYHDPSGARLGEILLDHLATGEAPLGPEAVVLMPPSRSFPSADVTLEGEDFMRGQLAARKALDTRSPADAAAEARRWSEIVSQPPRASYLRALAQQYAGRSRDAVRTLEAILSEHNDCLPLHGLMLTAASMCGDLAYYREVLRSIVTRRPIAGIDGSSDWIEPDPVVQARYADLLVQSAAHHDEAESWLLKSLCRAPLQAETYHYLADLWWRRGQKEAALLPYRIASCLSMEDEHYADAYAWALRKHGRVEEAIEWLGHRVERLTREAGGGAAWETLVSALEDFGFPERSLRCLDEGLRRRPEDGELATFAVRYLCRYEAFDRAARLLDRAELSCTRTQYLQAATELASRRGELSRAGELARAWVQASPHDMVARRAVLEFATMESGPAEAERVLSEWRQENPRDENLEVLWLDMLASRRQREARVELLRERVERNPLDGWAWRELAWDTLSEVQLWSGERLAVGAERFEELVQECARGAPATGSTLGLRAELAALKGDRDGAVALFERALHAAPDYNYALNRIFDLTVGRSMEGRRKVIAILDRVFSAESRDLALARQAALNIANYIGRDDAIAALERWDRLSPDDPKVAEAWADVQLYYGTGKATAEAILPRLERMSRRFPLHHGLGFSLGLAYKDLTRFDDSVREFDRLIELCPTWTQARISAARVLDLAGRTDEALKRYAEAVEWDPGDPELWLRHAAALVGSGQRGEAIRVLERAVVRLPLAMGLWERRIELLQESGRDEEALRVARSLVEEFPDGAYCHLLLARSYQTSVLPISRQAIEEAYRSAIRHNARLWEAVWEYSMFLCGQGEYERARRAIEDYLPLADDDTYARGGLAVIRRLAGERAGALESMRDLLGEQPDYEYGWRKLMDWVEEDEAWDLARDVLPAMADAIADDVYLACRRLQILKNAGTDSAEIEAGWRELVENRPTSLRANLLFFDYLFENGKRDEAGEVIENYARFDPDSPDTLARRIQIASAAGDAETACDLVEKLASHEGDDAPAAARLAIEALSRAGYFQAADRIVDLVKQGRRPMSSVFENLLALYSETKNRKALQSLARLLQSREFDWDHLDYLVRVLGCLLETGGAGWVAGWAKENPDLCRQDTRFWQLVGRQLALGNRPAEVVRWMSAWREREAVEMWALGNYSWACLLRGLFSECVDTCEAALEGCEHDASAPRIVERALLSALKLDDQRRFSSIYERHARLLELDPELRDIARVLAAFSELLRTDDPRRVRELHVASRDPRRSKRWPFLARIWRRAVCRRLPLATRLAFRLGLWGR